MLLNVYIFALREKSAPLLPDGTVQCAHLDHSKFTGRTPIKINKNNATAKIKILMELGII